MSNPQASQSLVGSVGEDPNLKPVRTELVVFCLVCAYNTVFACFTFAYSPGGALSALLVVLILAILLTELIGRHPSGRWLYLISVLTVSLATLIGSWNYRENYGLFAQSVLGRTYKNINAAESALAHQDAGEIRFAKDTTLDDSSSVGFREFKATFCVSPILGTPQQQKINFWAVGTDCCDDRGGFRCDDAKKNDVNGGLALPFVGGGFGDPSVPDGISPYVYAPVFAIVALMLTYVLSSHLNGFASFFLAFLASFVLCVLLPEAMDFRFKVASNSHEGYLKAIAASAALAGKEAVMPPVLVHWVKEPGFILAAWYASAVGVWVGTGAVHFLMTLIACVLIRWYYKGKIDQAQKQRRIAQYGTGSVGGPAGSTAGRGLAFRDPFLLRGGDPMMPGP